MKEIVQHADIEMGDSSSKEEIVIVKEVMKEKLEEGKKSEEGKKLLAREEVKLRDMTEFETKIMNEKLMMFRKEMEKDSAKVAYKIVEDLAIRALKESKDPVRAETRFAIDANMVYWVVREGEREKWKIEEKVRIAKREYKELEDKYNDLLKRFEELGDELLKDAIEKSEKMLKGAKIFESKKEVVTAEKAVTVEKAVQTQEEVGKRKAVTEEIAVQTEEVGMEIEEQEDEREDEREKSGIEEVLIDIRRRIKKLEEKPEAGRENIQRDTEAGVLTPTWTEVLGRKEKRKLPPSQGKGVGIEKEERREQRKEVREAMISRGKSEEEEIRRGKEKKGEKVIPPTGVKEEIT